MSGEKRIRELIDGYCSGILSEAEFEELETVLRRDPQARQELIEARALEADLRDHVSGVRGLVVEEPIPIDHGKSRHQKRRELLALAASIGFLALLAGFLLSSVNDDTELKVDSGVAVLTRSVDAKWKSESPREGDSLPPGLLQLDEGTVELEFYSGASIILEAPARLKLISEDRGELFEGRLTAEVPQQARGFTIVTPEIELVDLGTSFGMEVNSETGTGVHVFDGEVELFRPNEEKDTRKGESILAGDGREIDGSGRTVEIAADEKRFLRRSDFNELATLYERKKLRRWTEFSGSTRENKNLVAYYDFEPDPGAPRSLVNRATSAQPGRDGSVIGATWEQGRWPGKTALDFKRPSDRVRINLPGSQESLTLVAWIRIDGFDNKFSSLLLSDGWGRPGAMHWQIRSDSTITLTVSQGDKSGKTIFEAPFPMIPSDFGRWSQVAMVYDSSGNEVVLYRDANEINRVSGKAMIPIEIGLAEIGNWTPPARKSREVRNFNGRIDELFIYDRALTAKQISALFLRGNP